VWLIFLLIGIGIGIVIGLPVAAVAIVAILPLALMTATSPLFAIPLILVIILIVLLSAPCAASSKRSPLPCGRWPTVNGQRALSRSSQRLGKRRIGILCLLLACAKMMVVLGAVR